MPYELWRAGDLLVASKLNQMVPQMVSQGTDLTCLLNSTVGQTCDIRFNLDTSATYIYELFIGYSASTASDFAWSWNTGVNTFTRFTCSRAAGAASGLNVGADMVLRRPAAASQVLAQGGDVSGTVDPLNFMSCFDRGTIVTGTTSETNLLMVSQGTANATQNTVLRGGNATRILLTRVG